MNSDLTISLIEHDSPEYRAAVELREKILRRPLGLSFSPEELERERDSFHIGCFRGDELLGCLVLKPLETGALQMRQVAVKPEQQGQGIGRALVEFSEVLARERGFVRIVMHARTSALSFYRRFGYETQGEEFIEVTIPHVEMVKDL